MRIISYDKLILNNSAEGPFPYTFPILWGKVELDLPHFDGVNGKVHDISCRHIDMDLTGPTWTALPSGEKVLTYNGVNQYLQCPAADSTALNFTNEDFTLLAWIYGNPAGASEIMVQGAVDVDGWEFYVFPNNIALRTNQLGSHTEISAIGFFVPNTWQLVAVTRKGSIGQFYVNGLPVTTTLGTGLLDPVSCAGGNKFLIGVQNNEITNLWDGMMGHHRIYSRELSAFEIMAIWVEERVLYGV